MMTLNPKRKRYLKTEDGILLMLFFIIFSSVDRIDDMFIDEIESKAHYHSDYYQVHP